MTLNGCQYLSTQSVGQHSLVLCKQTTRVPGVGLWDDAGVFTPTIFIVGVRTPKQMLTTMENLALAVHPDSGELDQICRPGSVFSGVSHESRPHRSCSPRSAGPRGTADEARPPDLGPNFPSVLGSLRDLRHTLISRHIKISDLKDSVFIP